MYRLVELGSWAVGDWLAVGSLLVNAVLGVVVAMDRLRRYHRSLRLRFLLPAKNVHVHIPSREVGRHRCVVAQEDYEAADVLRTVLLRHGYEVGIRYVSPEGKIDLDPNASSIVVCGPKNSPIVRDFFNTLPDLRFVEEQGLWYFQDLQTGNKLLSPMDQEPAMDGDLAFLGRVRLPGVGQASAVLICGIHALGSLGIATLLQSEARLDELTKRVVGRPFYTLVRSRHSADHGRILETDFYLAPRVFH